MRTKRIKDSNEKAIEALSEFENTELESSMGSEIIDEIEKRISIKVVDDNFYKVPIENRTIILKPKNDKLLKNSIATIIRPVLDRQNKLITGQPVFTDEEKRKVVKVVDYTTERRLVGVVRLDLSNPIDAIDWAWMKHHPYIAHSKEEAMSSNKARYYIADEEKEVFDYLRRKKYESDLINTLVSLPITIKRQLARVLDMLVVGVSELDIDKFLFDAASKDYDVPIAKQMKTLLENKEKLKFLYLSKVLLDNGDITLEFGAYKFKNSVIATSYEEYVTWLSRPEQASFVALKYNQYMI